MSDQAILSYGETRRFHKQTLGRWLALSEPDGQALLRLVQELKMGENHLKDFLDWLQEIALRDAKGCAEILEAEELLRVRSDPRLGRSDKLKRVKEALRRLRFPRLTGIEDEIGNRIREMRLKPQIAVKIAPGLEGGAVTVEVKAASYDEMRRLIAELARSVEGQRMKDVFALLHGERSSEEADGAGQAV